MHARQRGGQRRARGVDHQFHAAWPGQGAALPLRLRADRLEQLEHGIEDVFDPAFVGVLVRCFGGEELMDAAHGRRLRDDL